jgi:hypothetical protein
MGIFATLAAGQSIPPLIHPRICSPIEALGFSRLQDFIAASHSGTLLPRGDVHIPAPSYMEK